MRAFCLFAILVVVSACSPKSPADAFRASPDDLARGKALFIGTCASYCHTTTQDGRDAPFLFDNQWLHGGTDQEIFASIAQGVPGTTMIGFKGKLPEGDDDIWRIVAHVTTTSG